PELAGPGQAGPYDGEPEGQGAVAGQGEALPQGQGRRGHAASRVIQARSASEGTSPALACASGLDRIHVTRRQLSLKSGGNLRGGLSASGGGAGGAGTSSSRASRRRTRRSTSASASSSCLASGGSGRAKPRMSHSAPSGRSLSSRRDSCASAAGWA